MAPYRCYPSRNQFVPMTILDTDTPSMVVRGNTVMPLSAPRVQPALSIGGQPGVPRPTHDQAEML